MSIQIESEFQGMKRVSEAVALTLKAMIEFAEVGMSTKELDEYGKQLLKGFGAKSAPYLTYKFPGWTCISVGKEFCHGIPSKGKIIREGDLINIDVSAELDGFWSDNGSSFVLGKDINNHLNLVNTSKAILKKAISSIHHGVRISDIGLLIETEAKENGFRVIKNLTGHGIGKRLHEEPSEITNYCNPNNQKLFEKNSVVAIETFISTDSGTAVALNDGWTMVGNRGGYMAQHEHTIVITDSNPIILTEMNGIWSQDI
jgi:methionyl aminopeptidase